MITQHIPEDHVEEKLQAAVGKNFRRKAYDINGVFATGCAKHGIPFLMYNIKNGEG